MLPESITRKLQKIQNQALCIIESLLDPAVICTKHNELNVTQLILLEELKLGYKLCHSMLPNQLSQELFQDHMGKSIVKSHNYSTRNKKIPNRLPVTNKKYLHSFLCVASREYKRLYSSTKSCKTLHHFVKECKKYLLSKTTTNHNLMV